MISILRKLRNVIRTNGHRSHLVSFTMFLPFVILILTICCSLVTCDQPTNETLTRNESAPLSTLLLVSFDGFRADYLQKYPLPNLQEFYSDGVLVDPVTNVFITKTFPNHYSLVTGLYEESHGIVANYMYDPVTNKTFSSEKDADPFWWNEATPIWVSVQNSGYKTAAAMWPGTDIVIQNKTSTYFMKYDSRVTFQERVMNVTTWLLEDKAVRFATLYWEQPDKSGHEYGPDNITEMAKVMKEVDGNIGFLMDHLKQKDLWGKINIILTSDHGMAQCSQERVIQLDNCLGSGNYTLVDFSPVAAVLPLSNASFVYNLLNKCHPNMKVYLKSDIPSSLHYKNNARIQPIILVADEGWSIVKNGKLPKLGDHGYDNALPSMHSFLAAHGPAFRKGYRMSSFSSVDLYPLMCHILEIQQMPNNGSFSTARCLLASESCLDLPSVIGIVIGSLMVLTTFTCLFIFIKNRVPTSSRPFARLELQEDDDDDPLID